MMRFKKNLSTLSLFTWPLIALMMRFRVCDVKGHGWPGEISYDHYGVLPRCNGFHSYVRHH